MSASVVQVELGGRGYVVRIGPRLIGNGEYASAFAGRPLRLVTDSNVEPLYAATVRAALQIADEHQYVVAAGEESKNWHEAERILGWLLESRLPRDGVVVALGGGVIGDLAGFCAAVYQRGIDFIQIPTTLLAQVDSSVGGKTGVNHPLGKNMLGAFHQPSLVLADTDTLATLPARELSAGLAEIIKYGMLGDVAFFAWLERHVERLRELDTEVLTQSIERSIAMKARIVGLDERESLAGGPRALLNLGHTFAHAVETWAGYGAWLHGEAVGLGLCMAADLSARLGWLAPDDLGRVEALVARCGLPTRPPDGMTPEDFRRLMARDKKVAAGRLRLVLLRTLGEACVTADFDPAQMDGTLKHFCRQAAAAAS
jgi:3-dehydroquinate synthase (EC 4.2.3.4)